MFIENSVSLPPDLRGLWNNSSGLVLFYDTVYGQSGLDIWSPDQTFVRHSKYTGFKKPGSYQPGDLIIGEFFGDSDLVVIRCELGVSDFGQVLISLPLDPRDDWYHPAHSLTEFLTDFVEAKGEKFWEVHAK